MHWEGDRRVQDDRLPPRRRRKISHFEYGVPVYEDECPFDLENGYYSDELERMENHMRAIQRGA